MAIKERLSSISGRQAARYMLLPEIMPRLRALGGSGFGYLAFLIASVYQMVRILPAGHAYTRPGNIGTFGIRDVVTEAANHVKLEWRNIDQIIIFFAIIAAIVILFLQFAAILLLLLSGQAFAQDAGDYSFFKTENPAKDVAFLLLDHVFGIPGFFGSEAATETPFHQALHTLFHFYNYAILIIAALIFVYYIVVVVVETAQSGTPFGQRFNTIYAPLRLVIALGLLVPLNYGLNGSQYIVLYAAKVGSGFATNGWLRFNETLENPLGAENKTMISEPEIPSIEYMVEHMALVHTCKAAYERLENKTIDMYLIVGGVGHKISGKRGGMSYDDAANITRGGDIKITFAHKATAEGPSPSGEAGYAQYIPYCGEINVPVVKYNPEHDTAESTDLAERISKIHFSMIKAMWADVQIKKMAEELVEALISGPSAIDSENYKPDQAVIDQRKEAHQRDFEFQIKSDFETHRDNVDMSLDDETKARGWGGAGIWYNRIAQTNGEVLSSIMAVPTASQYPMVTEDIVRQKRGKDASYTNCQIFEPNLSEGKIEYTDDLYDPSYARMMYHMQKSWSCDADTGATSNIFWDAMHMIFGIGGLFDMRCNNANQVHPLAQLTSIGKGMIDSSVRNMGLAMASSGLGGAAAALGKAGGDLSAMGQAGSGFFVTMATIGLSLGFLLFYILPFMPFLYFFFAVGAWVKEIFEAMCGAPLWALAHIKIDGEGLPGKSAINGYFLIFEIFLRPILIVVGLISGMVIFAASVHILNEIFDTAVLRLTGIDIDASAICTKDVEEPPIESLTASKDAFELDKHILDEFFFTVMYAIFVYMIAMSCFKMIDLVPNNILRFMGGSVGVFADEVQDPTENLAQYAAISGATIGGKVLGGINQAAGAGGSLVAAVPDIANRMQESGNTPQGGGEKG